MDNSRDADLKALHDRFSNPLLSRANRATAYRNFQTIQAKVKDRHLARLRDRLVRAHRACNTKEIENIEQLVREYSWRQGWSHQR